MIFYHSLIMANLIIIQALGVKRQIPQKKEEETRASSPLWGLLSGFASGAA